MFLPYPLHIPTYYFILVSDGRCLMDVIIIAVFWVSFMHFLSVVVIVGKSFPGEMLLYWANAIGNFIYLWRNKKGTLSFSEFCAGGRGEGVVVTGRHWDWLSTFKINKYILLWPRSSSSAQLGSESLEVMCIWSNITPEASELLATFIVFQTLSSE